jgi:hypothetical protein
VKTYPEINFKQLAGNIQCTNTLRPFNLQGWDSPIANSQNLQNIYDLEKKKCALKR